MRNLLFIFVFMVLCSGCILVSDAKYQADEAMWVAKAEASKAWAEQSNRPLASFTAVSGETFVVNNPNQLQPLPVTGEPNAIVQGADVILNSGVAKILGGGWAAGYMLGKVQGSYTANGNGSIDVTRDSGNSHVVDTGDTHDNSIVATDSHDATADPVIVEPDPIIVNPVVIEPAPPMIVRPQIVDSVIVGGE